MIIGDGIDIVDDRVYCAEQAKAILTRPTCEHSLAVDVEDKGLKNCDHELII